MVYVQFRLIISNIIIFIYDPFLIHAWVTAPFTTYTTYCGIALNTATTLYLSNPMGPELLA